MSKIMVVDDSPIIRKNLRVILEAAGHEIVAEATDGKEVLDNYLKYKPDLVTMDITMPIIDGITALGILMQAYPSAKVIMISAMGQKTKIVEAVKLGAKSFIVKPFEKDKVLEVVSSVLNIA